MEKGDIDRVLIRVPGQGGSDLRTGDVNTARGFVILKPWHEREHSASQIIAAAGGARRASCPGVRVGQGTPGGIGRRGIGQPLNAVIGGPDYERSPSGPIRCSRSPRRTRVSRTSRRTTKSVSRRCEWPIDRDRAADLGISLEVVGQHARDRARLAHRHDLRRSRPRVQRHRPGRDDCATDEHRSHEHPRALADDEGADPAVEHRAARGDLGNDAAVALQSPARRSRSRPTSRRATRWVEAVQWFTDTVAKELPGEASLDVRRRVGRLHAHGPAAVLHVPARARGRLPRARGAVRELRASADHHGHGAARACSAPCSGSSCSASRSTSSARSP